MLKTATQPLSSISQIQEGENREGRFYDLGSIAYLGSKTVQPMGGSSVMNNKVTLPGNLARTPNARFTSSGKAVTRFYHDT